MDGPHARYISPERAVHHRAAHVTDDVFSLGRTLAFLGAGAAGERVAQIVAKATAAERAARHASALDFARSCERAAQQLGSSEMSAQSLLSRLEGAIRRPPTPRGQSAAGLTASALERLCQS